MQVRHGLSGGGAVVEADVVAGGMEFGSQREPGLRRKTPQACAFGFGNVSRCAGAE